MLLLETVSIFSVTDICNGKVYRLFEIIFPSGRSVQGKKRLKSFRNADPLERAKTQDEIVVKKEMLERHHMNIPKVNRAAGDQNKRLYSRPNLSQIDFTAVQARTTTIS